MTITLTTAELSKIMSDQANWYSGMALYVITNITKNPHPLVMLGGRPISPGEFQDWCKRYEAEHPKPNWKDLLPE